MRSRTRIGIALTTVAAIAALAMPAAAQDGSAPAGGGGLTARDLTGDNPVPCPELLTDDPRTVGGGCIVLVPFADVDFTVRTMFGPMKFDSCRVGFNLHIGPTAEVWLHGMSIEGGGACGDILPCREKVPPKKIHLAYKLPWKGEIAHTSSGYRLAFDLCFDTCLGRFEGKTKFDLVIDFTDWKLRAVDSVAGTSGFEIDGAWDVDVAVIGADSLAYSRREGAGSPGFDLRPR